MPFLNSISLRTGSCVGERRVNFSDRTRLRHVQGRAHNPWSLFVHNTWSPNLDHSVLPRNTNLLHSNLVICLVALLVFLARSVAKKIPSNFFEDGTRNFFTLLVSLLSFIRYDLVPLVQLGSLIAMAKVSIFIENSVGVIRNIFNLNPNVDLDLKIWQPCVLDERELLPGNYIRYRFQLNKPSGTLSLSMGQELLMCHVDASKDRVLKETFFPITTASTRGYFDIVLRRGTLGDAAGDRFARCLDSLALGEELAIKSGRYRMNYQGEDDPIQSVSMVASGLGITPSLQMLRSLLPGRDSAIEEIELAWVNEDKADFICSKEVESFEYRYIDKFYVSRIVQGDLYGFDVSKNTKVRKALSPYEPGRLGVICGPDYVVSRIRALFEEMGYPSENILSVSMT